MEILKIITVWFSIWALVWAGYGFLKKKIDPIQNYIISGGYFFISSILVFLIYRREIFFYIKQPINLHALYFLLLTLIICKHIYGLLRKKYKQKINSKDKKRNLLFLQIKDKYFLFKSMDIIFQQEMIMILLFYLKNTGLSYVLISLIFSIIFGVGHIYLAKHNNFLFGIFMTISSIVSAFLTSYLLLFVPWGFLYTFSLHLLFYVFLGWFFLKFNDIKISN